MPKSIWSPVTVMFLFAPGAHFVCKLILWHAGFTLGEASECCLFSSSLQSISQHWKLAIGRKFPPWSVPAWCLDVLHSECMLYSAVRSHHLLGWETKRIGNNLSCVLGLLRPSWPFSFHKPFFLWAALSTLVGPIDGCSSQVLSRPCQWDSLFRKLCCLIRGLEMAPRVRLVTLLKVAYSYLTPVSRDSVLSSGLCGCCTYVEHNIRAGEIPVCIK